MLRVSVVVILGVLGPSVVQAQTYVIPSCVDPAVISRSSYGSAMPCVPLVPVPPTGVPAWLEPTPAPVPTFVPPPPVYIPPAYVPPPVSRGLDPSIILSGRPPVFQSPLNTMTQVLLLQQLLAARRERQQYSAPPPPPPPAPAAEIPRLRPLTTPETGWSRAFFKPVK